MSENRSGGTPRLSQLRAKAVEQLSLAPAIKAPARTAEELLHELQVHQIELEMQNDELRRAQLALEESHDRYVDLYDFAPVAYLTLTRDARISEINLTGAALLAVERKKLLHQRFELLVTAGDRDRWRRLFRALEEQNGRQTDELALQRPDGTVLHARLDGLRITPNYGPPAVRITLTDITERRHAEEALLEAKNQAERASRAKAEFLSNMSHELRTPLNTILGFVQVLELELDPRPGSPERESFDLIQMEGSQLLNLIDQVFDLARAEAGVIGDLSMERVGLQPLLKDCVQFMRPLAEARGLVMSLDEDSCAGLAVIADRTRMRQALLNLLSNAVKYNLARGRVELSCTLTGNDQVRIVVKDSGPGLTPEQQAHLFEPFNRLGRERLAELGAGVGLALTRRLMELMGGRVEVESAVGQGSSFWLELPVQRTDGAKQAPEGPAHADHSTGPANQTVLYVHDSPSDAKLMAHAVGRDKGLQLLTAHTGELGLELALVRKPDLIVLEVSLPGIDGYGVLRRLRDDPRTRHIPTIALSEQALPEQVQRGKAVGFADYLGKPLQVREFVGAVQRLLGRRMPLK